MKKVIAVSNSEYKDTTAFVTKEPTELYGIGNAHIQPYDGIFTLSMNGEDFSISNWEFDGLLTDLTIPNEVYVWKDTSGNVHHEKAIVSAVWNSRGTSGWTSKNKIRKFTCMVPFSGGNHLRGSTSLEEVTIGSSSNSSNVFYQCSKLHTANIYGSVGSSVFYGTTALKTVNLLETGITLGINAFQSSGLESIHIKGVSLINAQCFADCSLLEDVIIEDVVTIETQAFYNCSISGVVELPTSLEYMGYKVFGYNDITELRIPSTVSVIVASNTLQGGVLMGNSIEATIKTDALSKPSGWGDYFALRSETPTYHIVEYSAW